MLIHFHHHSDVSHFIKTVLRRQIHDFTVYTLTRTEYTKNGYDTSTPKYIISFLVMIMSQLISVLSEQFTKPLCFEIFVT